MTTQASADRCLFTAIQKSDWSTAKWLTGQGKGICYVHTDGSTMLHLAAKGRNLALVKLLLAKGAQVDARNEHEQTSLYVAVLNSASVDLLEALIKAGADVNAVDKGWTPLIAAVYKNSHQDTIKFLINNGADKTVQLPSGKTVLDFAKERNSDSTDVNINDIIMRPWAKSRLTNARTLGEFNSRRGTIATSVYSESVETYESTSVLDETAESMSSGSSISLLGDEARVYLSFVEEDRSQSEAHTKLVHDLAERLKEKGCAVCIDVDYSLKQSRLYQATKEIKTSTLFIPCLTTEYMLRVFAGCMDSAFLDLCSHEFTEAQQNLGNESILPIVLDERLLDESSWRGPVGLLLHNRRYTELLNDTMLDTAVMEVIHFLTEITSKSST